MMIPTFALLIIFIILHIYGIFKSKNFLDWILGYFCGMILVVIIVRIGFEQYQDRVKDHCQKEHKCVCKIK